MNLDSQVQQAMGELDDILSIFTAPLRRIIPFLQNKDCNKNMGEVYFT